MYNLMKSDLVAEDEGIWADYPHSDGISFKIAYIGCKNIIELYATHNKNSKLRKRLKKEESVSEVEILSNIITDWSGLVDKDGKEFEYNLSNIEALTNNEELKTLHSWIAAVSSDASNYSHDLEEAKKK